MMGGLWVDWVMPFAVFLLSCWMAVSVFRHYIHRHRDSHLFWGLSLSLSGLASLSYCLMIWDRPGAKVWFVLYYLFGAMWMPSIMGLGSLALVVGRKWLYWVASAVGVLGIVGTVLLIAARVNVSAMATLHGGAGTGVIANGAWLVALIVLNSFGALAVIVVALMSAWRTMRRRAPLRFFLGNLFLGVGVMVISAAGTAARGGLPEMFWITMFVGWIITSVGYVLLTPRMAARMSRTETEVGRAGSAS